MGKTVNYQKLRNTIEQRRLLARAKVRERTKNDLITWCNCRVEIKYVPGGNGPPMWIIGTVVGITDTHLTLHDYHPTAGAGPEYLLDHIEIVTYL